MWPYNFQGHHYELTIKICNQMLWDALEGLIWIIMWKEGSGIHISDTKAFQRPTSDVSDDAASSKQEVHNSGSKVMMGTRK